MEFLKENCCVLQEGSNHNQTVIYQDVLRGAGGISWNLRGRADGSELLGYIIGLYETLSQGTAFIAHSTIENNH